MKNLLLFVLLLGLVSTSYGQLTDKRDGKTYKTVKIGGQVWMAENLAFKPSNGNYWAYDNNTSNAVKYGYLYDWETANKVCPMGYHLPSDKEWDVLDSYLRQAHNGFQDADREPDGTIIEAGKKMKSITGWENEDGNAEQGNNSSGFSGLPGGNRHNSGRFIGVGEDGAWWSSTTNLQKPHHLPEGDAGSGWYRFLIGYNGVFYRDNINKADGFSVRCLRD